MSRSDIKYEDQPVRVSRRLYRCPRCDDGHIEFDGVVTHLAGCRHHCHQCGNEFYLPGVNGHLVYNNAYDGDEK